MTATEQHFSSAEVASLWGAGDAVRRLFEDQPGVLRISMPRLLKSERKHKPHVRLSIPAIVAARVHEQWAAGICGVKLRVAAPLSRRA